MNRGRAKCDKLKRIRKAVADRLHIDLYQEECTYEGNCTGTCPKCRQEEDLLNRELLKRAAGIGIGTLGALSLTGCSPLDFGSLHGTTGTPVEEYPEYEEREVPEYEETEGAPLEEWFDEEETSETVNYDDLTTDE